MAPATEGLSWKIQEESSLRFEQETFRQKRQTGSENCDPFAVHLFLVSRLRSERGLLKRGLQVEEIGEGQDEIRDGFQKYLKKWIKLVQGGV